MPEKRRQFGNLGEKVAQKYLQNKDYELLDRNYQNSSGRRLGEIDIIAFDKKEKQIVFVEVKTREYQKYQATLPEENITSSKLKKMAKISADYLRKKHWQEKEYRFDAISVWLDLASKKAKVKHIIGL